VRPPISWTSEDPAHRGIETTPTHVGDPMSHEHTAAARPGLSGKPLKNQGRMGENPPDASAACTGVTAGRRVAQASARRLLARGNFASVNLNHQK
jgi:hypothetical protein